jgi:DNA repair protein RadC
MTYYIVEEDEFNYHTSPMRKHFEALVGNKATVKLYDYFTTSNCIIRASEVEYKKAGLTSAQRDKLVAAKSLNIEAESTIRSSADAYYHFAFLENKQVEYFYILVLSRSNKVLNKILISQGGTTGTVVDTKVLMKQAIIVPSVNSIILCHNHPSGNLSPSQSDLDVTKKIVDAGKVLDIKVFDHLIIGNNGKYTSFADEGYM